MMDPTIIYPDSSSGQHICVPRYGENHDRCWCGQTVAPAPTAGQLGAGVVDLQRERERRGE